MRHRILRAVTYLVVFFFTWTMGGMFNIAYAAYHEIQKPSSNAKHEQRPEEKFQKAMGDLKDIVSRKYTLETKRNKIREKRDAIESLDEEIKSQFADTESKLKNAGLPQEILQRHYNFVKHYEDNLKVLKTNLDSAENAKTNTEFETQMQKIKQHLDKTSFKKIYKPLDPNKLPNRISDIKRKEPRTKPEEFQKDLNHRAGISTTPNNLMSLRGDSQEPWQSNNQLLLLASTGELSGLVKKLPKYDKQNSVTEPIILALAHDAPASADLSETIDVQLTTAIKAKAAELGYSPVKIYNWVRNNVEYVPTYGSIQGADMCLQTLQGNDFDIASLLIALLRASGIHTRYVYGTVELPINKVMNWVGGFTDANAAVNFIASGGTPVAALTSGGKISSVRMEHVWVEAYVKYNPLRGAKHITGQGDSWIPLDASYKQYTYTQGIDIKSAVPFDAQTFVNQIQSTANIDTANSSVTNINSTYIQQQMQNYQAQVKTYIEQNYPNATVGDVLGKKEIIKQNFTFLAGTLPYQKAVIGIKYSEIPDSLRHKITFKVTTDIYDEDSGTAINITKRLPEIAGKKITLSYSPATASDEAVIKTYADNESTSYPAYLINLVPELKINGSIISSGTSISMGNSQSFVMTFSGPNQQNDAISNVITAGSFNVIGLDLGIISHKALPEGKARLEEVKSRLEADSSATITKEEVLGEMLHLTALSYFTHLDVANYLNQRDAGIVYARLPSEAIVTFAMSVGYSYGMPMNASFGGISIDVDRDISIAVSKDGDSSKVKQFMVGKGMIGSAMEHAIMEELYSTQTDMTYGVSAVKIISIANDTGIPVYTIDKSNVGQIMPLLQLPDDVKTDIQNSINTGKIVTIPQTDINYHGWTGVGYVVMNPETGAAGYMINGGLAGGEAILAMLLFGLLGTKGMALLMIGAIAGAPAWITLLGTILIGLAIGLFLSQILSDGDKTDLKRAMQFFVKNYLLRYLTLIGSSAVWWIVFTCWLVSYLFSALNIAYNMPNRKRYYADSNKDYSRMVKIC